VLPVMGFQDVLPVMSFQNMLPVMSFQASKQALVEENKK
jgi:hypothetical protein